MAFGVEFLQFTKDEKNLLLKNLQLKTCVETVLILSWRTFFVGKYFKVFKAPKKWLFKWTVTFRDGAHAVVVHRKHASASKLPSCSVKRNPNLVSMLLRNRYRLCVRGGGWGDEGVQFEEAWFGGINFGNAQKTEGSSLCESCQTIINMMEANPPCLPVSFKSKQKNSPPRFYLYAIIITFNILASCEHQLLPFSLLTKYSVHFFCLSYRPKWNYVFIGSFIRQNKPLDKAGWRNSACVSRALCIVLICSYFKNVE